MIKQLSLFIANKKGRLAEITRILADDGIDIRALSLAETTDYGILRLIVDDAVSAEKKLTEAGLTVIVTEVLGISVPDVPGGFAVAMEALADAGIDVEYIYAFISRADGLANVILRVADNEKAAQILRNAGVTVIGNESFR